MRTVGFTAHDRIVVHCRFSGVPVVESAAAALASESWPFPSTQMTDNSLHRLRRFHRDKKFASNLVLSRSAILIRDIHGEYSRFTNEAHLKCYFQGHFVANTTCHRSLKRPALQPLFQAFPETLKHLLQSDLIRIAIPCERRSITGVEDA